MKRQLLCLMCRVCLGVVLLEFVKFLRKNQKFFIVRDKVGQKEFYSCEHVKHGLFL